MKPTFTWLYTARCPSSGKSDLALHINSSSRHLGQNLTSLKLTLFRIRLYKEGNVCALVTQCLPSIQESWHKEHHGGHTGTSVMAMVCMPDTNSYATLKRAGLAVSPAVNAYSESKRLDLLCNKIRKIKSNLF